MTTTRTPRTGTSEWICTRCLMLQRTDCRIERVVCGCGQPMLCSIHERPRAIIESLRAGRYADSEPGGPWGRYVIAVWSEGASARFALPVHLPADRSDIDACHLAADIAAYHSVASWIDHAMHLNDHDSLLKAKGIARGGAIWMHDLSPIVDELEGIIYDIKSGKKSIADSAEALRPIYDKLIDAYDRSVDDLIARRSPPQLPL